MNWRPHTQHPDGPEVAIIAVMPSEEEYFDDERGYIAAELYEWNVKHGCWLGETNGLLLKRDVFWWLPEIELLASLPSLP